MSGKCVGHGLKHSVMQNEKQSKVGGSQPVAPEGSCNFYVKRKNRFCKFKPGEGCKYCAEHAGLMGADTDRKRVQCPYDPKHTCYADKVQHHMKRCPSKPRQMPPYYSASINAGDDGGETVPEPKETVGTVPEDELQVIIDKVNRLYDEHIGVIEEEILNHECLQAEMANPTYGTAAFRHRKQQASLIGHMDKLGLLKDGMCYLEMGAGKGQLTHWLHEAVAKNKDKVFVLIDRSQVRNKMDNLHKEEEVMERIRVDIEHLRLDKVTTIQQHEKPVVAFGKHLCGPATDLTLRCVCETLNGGGEVEEEAQGEEGTRRKRLKSTNSRELAGAVIALCCHHRCTWSPYVGKQFFRACRLNARDFQVLSSMSSWATCAWKGWSAQRKQAGGNTGVTEAGPTSNTQQNTDDKSSIENLEPSDTKQSEKPEQLDTDNVKSQDEASMAVDETAAGSGPRHTESGTSGMSEEAGRKKAGGDGDKAENEADEVVDDDHRPAEGTAVSSSINRRYSQEERESIGRKCKRLIDHGRLLYLQEHGLKSCMKLYIEEFYTPENIVLLAYT